MCSRKMVWEVRMQSLIANTLSSPWTLSLFWFPKMVRATEFSISKLRYLFHPTYIIIANLDWCLPVGDSQSCMVLQRGTSSAMNKTLTQKVISNFLKKEGMWRTFANAIQAFGHLDHTCQFGRRIQEDLYVPDSLQEECLWAGRENTH